MSERSGERQEVEQENKAWVRQRLLEAAVDGRGISQPLMIGDVPVENGMTFEAVRHELHKLIDDGYVQLDPHFKPFLTEKGFSELVG